MKNNSESKFKEYVRPNQRWECNQGKSSCSCVFKTSNSLFPPSASASSCSSSKACQPVKKNDTWICTRSELNGGGCEQGPLPDGSCCQAATDCQPMQSLAQLRGRVTFTIFVLSLFSCILFLSGNEGTESNSISVGLTRSPGPLSHHHAGSTNCSDCHDVPSGITGLVESLVGRHRSEDMSQKCANCHQELGPYGTQPHSVAPFELENPTAGDEAPRTSNSRSLPQLVHHQLHDQIHGEQVACTSCHQEHQGESFDIQAVTNQKCHSCHSKSFHSFDQGHPEFKSYPFRKRTRIYFDHNSHFDKHFGDSKSDLKNCSNCHLPGDDGRTMKLVGYETACSSCHENQIKEDVADGLTVLSLPTVDLAAFEKANLDFGDWPDESLSSSLSSTKIPASAALILSSSANKSSIEWLAANSLNDLESVSSEERKTAHRSLMVLKKEIRIALGHDNSNNSQPSLFQELVPTRTLQQFQQKYLPDLVKSNSPNDEENDAEDYAPDIENQLADNRSIRSGFYIDHSDRSIKYKPTGHSDEFLKRYYELVATRQSEPHSIHQNALSPFSVGRCVKCHTIDLDEERAQINWHSTPTQERKKPFTFFSHSPHIGRDQDCKDCHTLAKFDEWVDQIYKPEFVTGARLETNRKTFSCDFGSIKKANCSQCHQQNRASENCLNCHNYHVR